MPEVTKIGDQMTLVPTASFPHAKWDFEQFNPVQSRLFEVYDGNTNICIAAATSAGKTVCAEIFMSHAIRTGKGKGIYVGPLKALAKEKEDDWTSEEHHFKDLKTSICTGDFRMTQKRVKELDEANVIVMTPEMLASRTRNRNSEKSNFLNDVSVIVIDESHLLMVPSRGDHIEVALMKMVEINPNIRVVLLSATMPNMPEICGWLSKITGRDTFCLESEYRPCPLNIHYETYFDGDKTYDAQEIQKVGTASGIVDYYSEDKFLIFAHTKRTGKLMVDTLARHGIKAEFHNADLTLKKRLELEKKFKTDKDFRVVVATSTLAWGLNLPARRVIILGVHRGLEVVPNYDIWQMAGRAGRPRFDPCGDVYVLVPESTKNEWIAKLKRKTPIRSTLLEYVGKEDNPHYKTLAFHVVSEIHHGEIQTKEGFHKWFAKSLAHFQDHKFDDSVIDKTIDLLEKCWAISVEDGVYECTAIGKIASMFYFSPFDVSDLRRNFKSIFDNKQEGSDYHLAMAMANLDSHRYGIVNRQEKLEIHPFKERIDKLIGENKFTDSVVKVGAAYFNLLQGKETMPTLSATQAMLRSDLDRTIQILLAVDNMSGKWGKFNDIRTMGLRFKYGVGADLVELCQIPNVGQARANNLKKCRVKTLEDFVSYDAGSLAKMMKCSLKLAEEALEGAKLIEVQNSLT